jgi:hypothetical protein
MFKNSSSGITPVCLMKRDVFGMVVVVGGDALLPFLAWNDVASFPQQQHNNNNQDKQHFYRRVWGGEEVITLLTKKVLYCRVV